MTATEMIALIGGSGVVGSIITKLIDKWTNKKSNEQNAIKLKNESDRIELDSDLQLTEFYRKQIEDMMSKYNILEQRLDQKINENEDCENRLNSLEQKYTDLQRQFTLFKTQMSGKK